jgi:Fic family protein
VILTLCYVFCSDIEKEIQGLKVRQAAREMGKNRVDTFTCFYGSRQRALEKATLALGRLDSVTLLLPDPQLFLYTFIRREAVLSSQIEGAQSSLSDLLLFELGERPGAPIDEVVEVSNCVAALEHGMNRLHEGLPLCKLLLREMHTLLMTGGRFNGKDTGEFRRTQNWIGGTRLGNARFVPPPPHEVQVCMTALEQFIQNNSNMVNGRPIDDMPVLLKAALAHGQFETIHPFLDGNGRSEFVNDFETPWDIYLVCN